MKKGAFRNRDILLFVSCLIFFTSCNNSADIPIPSEFSGFSLPESEAIELTDPQPLHWDTIGKAELKPTVFPLDFKKMKAIPFDSSGFKPIPIPPVTASFDFHSFPSKPFDVGSIKPVPLDMKIQKLSPAISSLNYSRPVRIASSTLDMKLWQQFSNNGYMVSSIVKDSSGLIWIGTTNGLFLFDGQQVSNVVPGAYIANICIDKQNVLWYVDIKEAVSAIVKVDLKNMEIGRAYLQTRISSLINMSVGNDGSIWIPQTKISPLMVLDPKKVSIKILDSTNLLQKMRYFSLTADMGGRIWFGTEKGIQVVDPQKKIQYQFQIPGGKLQDTIHAIYADPYGNIWAAELHYLTSINLKKGQITYYYNLVPHNLLASLMMDQDHQLWIPTIYNGCYILNTNNNTIRNVTKKDGLPNNAITAFYNNSSPLRNKKSGYLFVCCKE